ncbi:hypothetical protein [Azohydromonas caseinilytica]|uniref:Nickel-dependent hydrogenase n=1 Tax=Azohydromonas caseinilytica TaxID=2728836 RepID=A0A848F831_9BURK|nr:hypothetical protein [Azohydromonas caseinilytica]NML15724.1 hypothetical protein [Azohydromonas caseinilytica]
MSSLDALSGRLVLHPGRARPNIERQGLRRAERLVLGRPAASAPALLGTLFTLCGHAHTLTARRAIEAARGAPGTVLPPPAPAEARALQWRTAQEQLRRLLVDAPPAVGLPAATPALLQSCPLWQPALDAELATAALGEWVAEELLAQPLAAWLAAWECDGAAWLADWSAREHTPVARLLQRLRFQGVNLMTPHRPVHLDAADGSMQALCARLAAEAPLQDGAGVPYATGPWCRRHGRNPAHADNAWMLSASRLSDLVRLASPDGPATGAQALACGAARTGERTGLAWTETARGLLVHRIALSDDECVTACRVVSPTDWNFDARGPAALALQSVREPAAVQALVLGFDPCMAWRAATQEEALHA